jgi:hypothetical protein
MWPIPLSGQSPKFQKFGMMVLYRSEISCKWWKNPRILNLSPCTQKLFSLLPWYTEFAVYFCSYSHIHFQHSKTFPKIRNDTRRADLIGQELAFLLATYGILKFEFLRVATPERFSEVLLFGPQGPVFMAWKWFYRVQEAFSQNKSCQIYPRKKFLEQNFES